MIDKHTDGLMSPEVQKQRKLERQIERLKKLLKEIDKCGCAHGHNIKSVLRGVSTK